MITFHYYLDTRATDGPAPLKLAICKRGDTAYMPTGIRLSPEEWDAKEQKVVRTPRRAMLNAHLSRLKLESQDYLLPMIFDGRLAGCSAREIKDELVSHFSGKESTVPPFSKFYEEFISRPGSEGSHREAGVRCRKIMGSLWDVPADELDERWVAELLSRMKESYAPNTIKSTVAQVRLVWRSLEAQGVVSGHPFRNARVTVPRSKRRDLSADQMCLFLTAPCESERERLALDFFSLSFYLIAMNPVDLTRARESDVFNGRLMYQRSKTGKAYSVRIYPEAQEIIERRKGDGFLFLHDGANYTSFNQDSNYWLKKRSSRLGIPHAVTMYWARHSWASLAFELGTSIELVSAALGHSYGAQVTMGYVDIRERQVDEVNRKVIDYATKRPRP